MFERYTEKARRVIFFARYEASQYGSSSIETEHLLLGLLREGWPLVRRFLGPGSFATDIRTEIEKQVPRGRPIPTSVEIPLTGECKKALKLAAEASGRLGRRHIETEHILIGILSVEGSLAARVLREKGLKLEDVREQLANTPNAVGAETAAERNKGAIATLDSFLAGLKWYNWEKLSSFFAREAQFVDATGRRWIGRDEIEKQFEAIFAPYAKKNVTFFLEGTYLCFHESVAASILWENVTIGGETTRSMHRMTIVLAPEGRECVIFLLQVTPVVGM